MKMDGDDQSLDGQMVGTKKPDLELIFRSKKDFPLSLHNEKSFF
jgi:hypothetical protein